MVSQNITLKARIVDVNTNEYLYRLDVTEQGETGNAFGSPSLVRAQKEAILKCLETVFSDLNLKKSAPPYSIKNEDKDISIKEETNTNTITEPTKRKRFRTIMP